MEHGLSTRSSSPKCGLGLNQVELGPNPMTTRRFRTQTNLRSNVDPVSNVPERRRLELSQRQADRPKGDQSASNCFHSSHATATDFRKESRASTQRRWPDGRIPRPASLGEADRPHLVASSALPWHERQAQLPYLCTTEAQLSTDHRVM